MTDGGCDELLERLRKNNPVPCVCEAASSADRLPTALGSSPRRRWRRRNRRRGADDRIDGLLRAANPYPAPTVDSCPATVDALFRSIVEGPTPRRRRRRLRSPRGFAVAIVAVASLAASAFGYVFAERDVTNAASVRCYQHASLGTRSVGIIPVPGGAVGSCRSEVWSEGGFGSPTEPRLVGCVLADGIEGVFPGDDGTTCTRLGLSAAGARTATANRLAELQALLVADLDPESRCLPPASARRVALDDLAQAELRLWTVRVAAGASSARPCTQAYVLTSSDVIELDPFPRLVHHQPVDTTAPRARTD